MVLKKSLTKSKRKIGSVKILKKKITRSTRTRRKTRPHSPHHLALAAKHFINGTLTLKALQMSYAHADIQKIILLAEKMHPAHLPTFTLRPHVFTPTVSTESSEKLHALIARELRIEASRRHMVCRSHLQDGYWCWNKTVEQPRHSIREFRFLLNILPTYYGEVASVLFTISKTLEMYGIQCTLMFPKNFSDPNEAVLVKGYVEMPITMTEIEIREYRALVDKFLTQIPLHAKRTVAHNHL